MSTPWPGLVRRIAFDDPCVKHMTAILAAGGVSQPAFAARRLVSKIGSLADVLAASSIQIRKYAGDNGAGAIRGFRQAMQHALRVELSTRPIIDGWQVLSDYLRMELAGRVTEQARILYFHGRDRLICEDINDGTIDTAPLFPREVIRRALEVGASAIILAHNHPGGDPKPSSSDIGVTRAIVDAARAFDIAVHDHVIVGRNEVFSMRSKGLL